MDCWVSERVILVASLGVVGAAFLSSCAVVPEMGLLTEGKEPFPYVEEREWKGGASAGMGARKRGHWVTTRTVDWSRANLRVRPYVEEDLVVEAARGGLFTGSPFGPEARRAGQLLRSGVPAEEGNRVMILDTGYDALLMRVHLIRNAKRSIDVQTFVWLDDEVGRLVMRELIAAAERGVKVRVITDHLGSERSVELGAHLAGRHPNFEVALYRPLGQRAEPNALRAMVQGLAGFRNLNQRMHNKLMTFDGVVGITGGRNYDNQYYDHSTSMNFRDRDVMVVGPAATQMAGSFEEFWEYEKVMRLAELKDVARYREEHGGEGENREEMFTYEGLFEDLQKEADDDALIAGMLSSGLSDVDYAEYIADRPGKSKLMSWNDSGRMTERIRKTVLEARERLTIQSPYFVMNEQSKGLFKEMVKANPDLVTTVSTNSFESTDQLIPYAANLRLRRAYVKKLGLHVYEIKSQPGHMEEIFSRRELMLARYQERGGEHGRDREPFICIHAKSFVMDGETVFVGSFNLDPRSANLNTEVGLLIRDKEVARKVEDAIRKDMAPGNSYVVASKRPAGTASKLNILFQEVSDMLPLDIWPIYDTTCFELKPGAEPVPPDDPDFHENYERVGSFPTEYEPLEKRRLETRFYKSIGGIITPLL
jgi:putative cardiolipin synthase